MSNLFAHAERELAIAASQGDLAVSDGIDAGIKRIIRGFSEQGHSGGSASIVGPRVGHVVGRLLAFEPITPLTGEPDEWMDISEGIAGRPGLQQNVRCSRVFRERNADDQLGHAGWTAYALDEVVIVDFRDWIRGNSDVASYTGWDSRRRIEFPWQPGRPRRVVLRRLERLRARLNGTLVTR